MPLSQLTLNQLGKLLSISFFLLFSTTSMVNAATDLTKGCGGDGDREYACSAAKAKKKGKAPTCAKGEFKDVLTDACWSCGSGWDRSASPDVNASNACIKGGGNRVGAWLGGTKPRGFAEVCDIGRGHFPGKYNGGERRYKNKDWCLRCPPNFTPNHLKGANDPQKCVEIGSAVFEYQKASRKSSLACHDKYIGSFHDTRNGGECWSCPAGYDRNFNLAEGFSVTAANACVPRLNALCDEGLHAYESRQCDDKSGLCANRYTKCGKTKNCGVEDGRPCYVWERIPSCDEGLYQDFQKGKCLKLKPGQVGFLAGLSSYSQEVADNKEYCKKWLYDLPQNQLVRGWQDGANSPVLNAVLKWGPNCGRDAQIGFTCKGLDLITLVTSPLAIPDGVTQVGKKLIDSWNSEQCKTLGSGSAEYTRATIVEGKEHGVPSDQCPGGSYWHIQGSGAVVAVAGCWTCPEGYTKSLNPDNNASNACVKIALPNTAIGMGACAVSKAFNDEVVDGAMCISKVVEKSGLLSPGGALDVVGLITTGGKKQPWNTLCNTAGETMFDITVAVLSGGSSLTTKVVANGGKSSAKVMHKLEKFVKDLGNKIKKTAKVAGGLKDWPDGKVNSAADGLGKLGDLAQAFASMQNIEECKGLLSKNKNLQENLIKALDIPKGKEFLLCNEEEPGNNCLSREANAGVVLDTYKSSWKKSKWTMNLIPGTRFVRICASDGAQYGYCLNMDRRKLSLDQVEPSLTSSHWKARSTGVSADSVVICNRKDPDFCLVSQKSFAGGIGVTGVNKAAANSSWNWGGHLLDPNWHSKRPITKKFLEENAKETVQICSAWKKQQCLTTKGQGKAYTEKAGPGWDSAQWALVPDKTNKFSRICSTWKDNTCLHIQNGKQDGPLAASKILLGDWSAMWSINKKTKQICNRWKTKRCLNIEEGKLTAKTVKPGWLSAKWNLGTDLITQNKAFVPSTTSPVQLCSGWKKTQCLTIKEGAVALEKAGAGWDSAKWEISKVKGKAFVRLCSNWKKGQCLNIENGVLESGSIQKGDLSAMWLINKRSKQICNRWKPKQCLNLSSEEKITTERVKSGWLSAKWDYGKDLIAKNQPYAPPQMKIGGICSEWKKSKCLVILESGQLSALNITKALHEQNPIRLTWNIAKVRGTKYVRFCARGDYNKPITDQCLNIENGQLEAGYILKADKSAMWKINEKTKLICNRLKPKQCLTIKAGKAAVEKASSGWLSAKWTLDLYHPDIRR